MAIPKGPYDEEVFYEELSRKESEKENDPFKGECRSCGAELSQCNCWNHYKE